MKMESILKAKGERVITALPHAKVMTIAHRMKLERIGAVVITEDDKTVQGIITERFRAGSRPMSCRAVPQP